MSKAPSPRLAPIPPDQWGEDARAALANAYSDDVATRLLSTEPGSTPMPNALSTLMHHPALAGPFLTYNNVLLLTPALDPRARELIVLRVAWRTRSRYEWVQHLRLAPRVGITPEEIAAVADGGAAAWTPVEADLLAATDQLVELVFVVGTYTCLAMAFKSFGLELDAELQELASNSFGNSLPKFEE